MSPQNTRPRSTSGSLFGTSGESSRAGADTSSGYAYTPTSSRFAGTTTSSGYANTTTSSGFAGTTTSSDFEDFATWPSTPPNEWGFPPPPPELTQLLTAKLTPQKKFKIPKDSWVEKLRSMPEAAEAVDSLPGWINRDDTVDAFISLWPHSVVGAFAVTMVWAYGEKAGYAPYRAARILAANDQPYESEVNPRVVDTLQRSLDVLGKDGPVDGFSFLNDCTHKVRSHKGGSADLLVGVDCGRIYGFGPSFFTKWLHIGSLAAAQSTHYPFDGKARFSRSEDSRWFNPEQPTPHVAPMLDSQAVSWLHDHALAVDHACRVKDEAHRLLALHRKWHTESVFSECDDHCPFEGNRGELTPDGLLPIEEPGSGWAPTTPEGDVLRIRTGRTEHYARFVQLLETWGAPYGLDASETCDRLYRLIRKDGAHQRSAA